MAFKVYNPLGTVQFLVFPKDKMGLTQLSNAGKEHQNLLGHLMLVASKVAAQEGIDKTGFRVVINNGEHA